MSRAGREVRVRRYPTGAVGDDDFEVVEVPVPDPGPGQVLVRNTLTSVDPGLRLRLRTDAPAGYFAAFPLGRAMDGIMAVGEVVESRADDFAPGDTVSLALVWRDYAVIDPTTPLLGGIGTLTRLWVSAAAGAVGSLAVQIARLSGNRVIASAGTDDKVAWLREELGVEAFQPPGRRAGCAAERARAGRPRRPTSTRSVAAAASCTCCRSCRAG